LTPIIFRIKCLNQVIYINSSRPHKIVQVKTLHVLGGILVIEIYEIKVVDMIYPRGCYQLITVCYSSLVGPSAAWLSRLVPSLDGGWFHPVPNTRK